MSLEDKKTENGKGEKGAVLGMPGRSQGESWIYVFTYKANVNRQMHCRFFRHEKGGDLITK